MANEFSCQCCGQCCEGKGGIVISPKDIERLCTHLQLTLDQFSAQYAELANGKLVLQVKEDNLCVFFTVGMGCNVHEAKPDICRAWPYFRGNLIDSESLAMAKDFCPGIPAQISFQEFQLQGIHYLRKHGLTVDSPQKSAHALYIDDLFPEGAKHNSSSRFDE